MFGAKQIAVSFALQKTFWIRLVLFDIQPSDSTFPVHFFWDSSSAVKITLNTSNIKARKHIDTKHLHLLEAVNGSCTELEHVASPHN